jgi:hypothetical protein
MASSSRLNLLRASTYLRSCDSLGYDIYGLRKMKLRSERFCLEMFKTMRGLVLVVGLGQAEAELSGIQLYSRLQHPLCHQSPDSLRGAGVCIS